MAEFAATIHRTALLGFLVSKDLVALESERFYDGEVEVFVGHAAGDPWLS